MGERARAAITQDLSKTQLCNRFCDVVVSGVAG
jgi:hypothetical protein